MHSNKQGNTLRILNVLFDNRIGGPQNRVLSLAKELRKHGIETIIVAPRGEGGFARRAIEQEFKVHQVLLRIPRHFDSIASLWPNLLWFLAFPFSVLAISKVIDQEQIDIVHINGLLNLQAPVAALLKRKRIVWHLSSTEFPKIIVSFLMPFVRLASSHIVIIARRLEHYHFGKLGALGRDNVSLIYGCVDIKEFNAAAFSQGTKDRLRTDLDIKPGEKIVGCVGNINPAKGYEYFIQTAALVKKQIEGVRFVIAGAILDTQKRYYQKLQATILSLHMGRDIIFAGKTDNVPEMLSIFDIFMLPSISEGGPRVTVEAMAMEKPVVATDVGAVSEQIISGETGIIVPPRDPRAMAEAIIYLLEHPEEANAMGKRARPRVSELFSLERGVAQHIKLYHEVMSKKQ